jgi:hypothetical protein
VLAPHRSAAAERSQVLADVHQARHLVHEERIDRRRARDLVGGQPLGKATRDREQPPGRGRLDRQLKVGKVKGVRIQPIDPDVEHAHGLPRKTVPSARNSFIAWTSTGARLRLFSRAARHVPIRKGELRGSA